MKQLLLINPENVSEVEAKSYPIREAVRAIVLDDEDKIAVLHVSNKEYYKLPGGGIEGEENHLLALQRECEEEIGCAVEVLEEVGSIVEYRKMSGIKQIPYCYLTKIRGQKGEPHFTDEETTSGFEQIWTSYADALRLISESQATDMEGRGYIVPRDTALLKAAKDKI